MYKGFMLHFRETSAKSIVLKPEYKTCSMTYCDIPPARIVAQSVCNVVAQTLGQVVHELRALHMKTQNISQTCLISTDLKRGITRNASIMKPLEFKFFTTVSVVGVCCDERNPSITVSRKYAGVFNRRNQ